MGGGLEGEGPERRKVVVAVVRLEWSCWEEGESGGIGLGLVLGDGDLLSIMSQGAIGVELALQLGV